MKNNLVKRFLRWSLPVKIGTVGGILGIISFIFFVPFFNGDSIYDKIYEKISPKPKIIVNIQKYSGYDLNSSKNNHTKILFYTMCNIGTFQFNNIINTSGTINQEYIYPGSFSNMICRFSNGTPCIYYTITISNIGKSQGKDISLDIDTSSSEIEYTDAASSNIELNPNRGFFESGFRIDIRYLDINERADTLIKVDNETSFNVKCRIDGAPTKCVVILSEMTILNPTSSITNIIIDGKPFQLDISSIKNSYEPIIYRYDYDSQSFVVMNDINVEFDCNPEEGMCF